MNRFCSKPERFCSKNLKEKGKKKRLAKLASTKASFKIALLKSTLMQSVEYQSFSLTASDVL